MSKRKIIIFSIMIAFVALLFVLFGAVFRLRHQYVKLTNDSELTISSEDIIKTAGFKYGQSVLLLDKDVAASNLEATYPEVKVVQIKTLDLMSVEIRVRKRIKTYYAEVEDKYYILDEELKVIEICSILPTDLIKLDSNLKIDEKTKVCDFVGTKNERNITYNLIVALITTVKHQQGDETKYLEREEISDLIQSITFQKGNNLQSEYVRLIIKTCAGIEIDIAKPEKSLSNKINMCFALYESLSIEQRSLGRIKVTYDNNNNEICGYGV